MKQVIILAGGMGTRLQQRLGTLPKPMISIAGIPLLERQIVLAKRYQFQHVVLLVNYQARVIEDFCASNQNWGLDITLLHDKEQAGTGGALLNAYAHLEDEFLVMYGDTMLDVDLTRFYQFHKKMNADATLFVHPNDHPYDSDLVEIDSTGKITSFHPHPHNPTQDYINLVNAALYCLKKDTLTPIRPSLNKNHDIANDLFPIMLHEKRLLYGYQSPEYIKDIGTPERLDKVVADFHKGYITQANFAHTQSAIFLDQDILLNSSPALSLNQDVSCSIKAINHSPYRAMGLTRLFAQKKLDTVLGHEKAYLDHHCICDFSTHSYAQMSDTEATTDAQVVEQTLQELNISISNSWIIGHHITPMMIAKKTGLRSISLMTKAACLHDTFRMTPDYEAQDLQTAVRFILHDYPALFQRAQSIATSIQPGQLIAIAGLSKSGKTTWSNVFKDVLQQAGHHVVILSLDRWLKSAQDRRPGVLARYDMLAIDQIIHQIDKRIHQNITLTLPFYHRLKRECIEQSDTVLVTPNTIIILEGVIALLSEKIRQAAMIKIFVPISETLRKSRVIKEYERRGENQDSIHHIYHDRERDETPIVLASQHYANIILDNADANIQHKECHYGD